MGHVPLFKRLGLFYGSSFFTTRKRAIGLDQKYHLQLHPVLMRALVPGATAAGTFDLNQVSREAFGTGSWHNPVLMIKNWHRFVP